MEEHLNRNPGWPGSVEIDENGKPFANRIQPAAPCHSASHIHTVGEERTLQSTSRNFSMSVGAAHASHRKQSDPTHSRKEQPATGTLLEFSQKTATQPFDDGIPDHHHQSSSRNHPIPPFHLPIPPPITSNQPCSKSSSPAEMAASPKPSPPSSLTKTPASMPPRAPTSMSPTPPPSAPSSKTATSIC